MSNLQTPFRYDFVGSFLRPQALKDAKAAYQAGEISKEAFDRVAEEEVAKVVAKQKELELAIMRRHHVRMPAASGAAPASGKAAAGREPCPKTGQPGDEPPDGQKSLRP